MKPRIAITSGDPAGIGPEIVLRAAGSGILDELCDPIVIGDMAVMERAAALTEISMKFITETACPPAPGTLKVLSGDAPAPGDFEPGIPQAICGEAAYRYLLHAIDLVRAGSADAVVTAPLSKEALHMAGHNYAGHTEILAEATGVERYALMLVDGPRRVVHATCHVPLARVADQLTTLDVYDAIRLGGEATSRLGVQHPRIIVCGLNPHAGEGGLFGDEEERVIRPAVDRARREGFDLTGPTPSETVFVRAFGGDFDLAVAMYHDQGHIPFKLASFRAAEGRLHDLRGVNMTLGLPIIRTSVDHGTAWDIAWKGTASPDSLIDAVSLATRLIGRDRQDRL